MHTLREARGGQSVFKPRMFRFNFESVFLTKDELRAEVEHLLWRIDHAWPVLMLSEQIDWIRQRTDEAWIKINGGARRQSLETVEKP